MYYDLIIRNGQIPDFTSSPLIRHQDLGILNGKLYFLSAGSSEDDHAAQTIRLKEGDIVSPGFIDFHSHVNCSPIAARQVLLQGATTTIGGQRFFDGRRINDIDRHGFYLNQGLYLSHSFTLRRAIGLSNPYAAASNAEITQMLQLAERFFQSGSYGLYFGLEMMPGTSLDEIVQLSRLARSYHQIVLIHPRNDGIGAVDAIREVIEIARETHAKIHILHLMYMAGHPDSMREVLELIQNARNNGLDITADTVLYEAFPSYIGSAILDDGWESNYLKPTTCRDVLISSGIDAGQFCSPQRFRSLRIHSPNTLVTVFAYDESANDSALQQPWVFVSTNAADGPVYHGIGHPATAGTFPKLIRKYVRQRSLLSLGDALYKITAGPARRFGLEKKGELLPGYDADLTIFSFDEMEDTARFINEGQPDSPPKGIHYVIIDGKIAVKSGQLTEETSAGAFIRAANPTGK